jgi:ParB family chromosome partitioning protein
MKKKGLGRGLEALLGEKQKPTESGVAVSRLPLSALQAGKYQPRQKMDSGPLQELAESIREQGIMQPLLVRAISAGKYEIIAGERRFRAAKLAGLTEVPVLVSLADDKGAAAMALIENMQREDLNPLEESQGLARLIEEFGFTHEQAAKSVGKSRSAISNLLRLAQLAKPVQAMLLGGDIDMGHARALLPLPGASQVALAQKIIAQTGSRPDVRFEPPIDTTTKQGLPSIRQAREILGWFPVVPLDEGLKRTIDFMRGLRSVNLESFALSSEEGNE